MSYDDCSNGCGGGCSHLKDREQAARKSLLCRLPIEISHAAWAVPDDGVYGRFRLVCPEGDDGEPGWTILSRRHAATFTVTLECGDFIAQTDARSVDGVMDVVHALRDAMKAYEANLNDAFDCRGYA